MRIQTIHTGNFKLDGGAMFGTVPKSIWQKINPADEQNLCNWAMRCLLVEDGNRLILIDNGMGTKQSEKFYSYYHLNGDFSLTKSLHQAGVDFSDITDVILTHLHFDHCGGSVMWDASKTKYELAFPNAKYWVHPHHWASAMAPNVREKPSFLQENMLPIKELGHLYFVDESLQFSDNISFLIANGHTDAMLCPKIKVDNKTLVFTADMIPSAGHIKPNYVMGYDIRPLDTMAERQLFMTQAAKEGYVLFFEHDLHIACATVQENDGRFDIKDSGELGDFFNLH